MLTPDQIKSKEFHTTGKSSYKAEEVDEFLNEIHASYDQMFRENANIIKKMSILANKVEEYKKDEDSLRQALLSAQKLADRIVSEAKENSEKQLSEASQQAEGMLSDASQKAEKILDEAKRTAEAKVHEANKQADEIIGGVNRKVTQEKLVLEMLKKEVAAFRTKMMDMYKEHLTLLDRLPTYSEEPKEEAPQDVEPETAQEAVEAPVEEADEVEEVAEAVEPVEDTVEEEAAEAVEETAEETVKEPVEDDTFELTDIENILDDVDEADGEEAFALDENAFDDEPEDEFEDVSSDVSEDNGGFSLNIDELDFDDDDDSEITADADDYEAVDEVEDETGDEDDDGAISFKKFFKKK